MDQRMPEVEKKSCTKKGELVRLRLVMSDEVIVYMRFVLCAVSLLALK